MIVIRNTILQIAIIQCVVVLITDHRWALIISFVIFRVEESPKDDKT